MTDCDNSNKSDDSYISDISDGSSTTDNVLRSRNSSVNTGVLPLQTAYSSSCDTTALSNNNNNTHTDLENAVILNDDVDVLNKLKAGGTIFISTHGICQKICNGYYDRKKQPHSECRSQKCYKTAVLYGLRNNYMAYKTIYKDLYDLLIQVPDLRPQCMCCSQVNVLSPDMEILHTAITAIMAGFRQLKCECPQKLIFCNAYKESYLHFKQVYDILNTDIVMVRDKLMLIYNITTGTDLVLEEFDGCIFDLIIANDLINCGNIPNGPIDQTQVNIIVGKLITVINWYLTNIIIMGYMFNEQAYEIYQYTLNKKKSEYDSTRLLNLLYATSNEFTDINYIQPFQNNTILSLTVATDDFYKLATELIQRGSIFNVEQNLVIVAITNKFYRLASVLIEFIPINSLYDNIGSKTILEYIISKSDINIKIKVNMIRRFLLRNTTITDFSIISLAINSRHALQLLRVLFENATIVNAISYYDTTKAITLKKADVLDLLFFNGADVNGDQNINIPLFVYFDTTSADDTISLSILNTILKYNPMLNILNQDNLTLLLLASQDGRTQTVKLLINNGADAFITNQLNGNTCLINAIINSNYSVVELLIGISNMTYNLVNIVNNAGSSAMFVSLLADDPSIIIKSLLKNNALNYNYRDSAGRNVLYYITETHNISASMKLKLFTLLVPYINIVNISSQDTEPIIVRTSEHDLYDITRLLLNQLIQNGDVIVQGELNKYINGGTNILNIYPADSLTPNFYPLITKYLRIISNNKLVISNILGTITNDTQRVKLAFILILLIAIMVIRQL